MIFNYCIYFMWLENIYMRFLECHIIIMSHGIKRQVDLKLPHPFKHSSAIQVFDLAVNNRRTYVYYFATRSCFILKPHWAIWVFEIHWFDTNFVRCIVTPVRLEREFIAYEDVVLSRSIVCYVYLFILAYSFRQDSTVFSKFV